MSPHIGHTRDLLYYRPEKGGEERYISEFVEQSMLGSGRPQLAVLRTLGVTKVDRNVDKIVLLLHFPPDSSLLSSNTLLYSGRITHLAPIFQKRVKILTRDDIIYCDSWDDMHHKVIGTIQSRKLSPFHLLERLTERVWQRLTLFSGGPVRHPWP